MKKLLIFAVIFMLTGLVWAQGTVDDVTSAGRTIDNEVTANINRYVDLTRISTDWNIAFGNLLQTKVGETVATDEVHAKIETNEELLMVLKHDNLTSEAKVRMHDGSMAWAHLPTWYRGLFRPYGTTQVNDHDTGYDITANAGGGWLVGGWGDNGNPAPNSLGVLNRIDIGRGTMEYRLQAKIQQNGLQDPAASYKAVNQAIITIR